MIPLRATRATGSVQTLKDIDSRLRQHNTDIDRLWSYMQEQTGQGIVASGQPPSSLYPGDIQKDEFEGEVASDTAAPTNGWTGPASVPCVRYGKSGTTMAITTTTDTVLNRDKNTGTITAGTYVRWKPFLCDDGTVEFRFSYLGCS